MYFSVANKFENSTRQLKLCYKVFVIARQPQKQNRLTLHLKLEATLDPNTAASAASTNQYSLINFCNQEAINSSINFTYN